MSRFVEVVAKSTGDKQIVPAHWLDHPVLGKDFQLTTEAKAAAKAESAQKSKES